MKLLVSGLLVAVLTATGAFAAKAPKAGAYAVSILVESVSGQGCLDFQGAQFAGIADYSGFTGTTVGLRVPIVENGIGAGVSTQRLTITSGQGTRQPHGTFTWTGRGSGIHWDTSGSFFADITEIDSDSFVAVLTEDYTPQCEEKSIMALTRIK